MDALRERLGKLGLLRRDVVSGDPVWPVGGAPEGMLLRLCEAGLLEAGLSVALTVRPDELFGALCAAIGGQAREVKLVDVRDKPFPELFIHFQGRDEAWSVEGMEGLIHHLNALLWPDVRARAVALLGEWQDALQLVCVEKRRLPQLMRERFFTPRNAEQLLMLMGEDRL